MAAGTTKKKSTTASPSKLKNAEQGSAVKAVKPKEGDTSAAQKVAKKQKKKKSKKSQKKGKTKANQTTPDSSPSPKKKQSKIGEKDVSDERRLSVSTPRPSKKKKTVLTTPKQLQNLRSVTFSPTLVTKEFITYSPSQYDRSLCEMGKILSCDYCGVYFRGLRHTCTQCTEFDVCPRCWDGKEPKIQKFCEHPRSKYATCNDDED